MPKTAIKTKFRRVLIQQRQPKEWDMPAALKKALEEHELWPHLKATHWQKVARDVLGLPHDIRTTERSYNVIRMHVRNEQKRQKARAATQLVKKPEHVEEA